MGYEVRVAYTLGERKKKYNPADQGLQKKMGYREQGILILERENEEYVFDVGFDYCNIELEDDRTVFMRKGRQVSIYSQYNSTNSNHYNIDFTEADSIGLHGAERRIDKQIKRTHLRRGAACDIRAVHRLAGAVSGVVQGEEGIVKRANPKRFAFFVKRDFSTFLSNITRE